MRGITFALLITFVEPAFSHVKTYLYNYEGLILNGLEKDNSAKSGIKLTCQVKISRVSEENHLLKVLSPQLEEYNGIWPEDPFTKASKVTERIEQCFAQIFKFEYRRGRVGNIYAPKDVSIMCVNLIKGILNLLQITIKESLNVYELQEVGVGGTCLTRYIIQEKRKDNKFTILRSKDLNNCTNKVVKNIGMAYVRPCPTCPVNITTTRGTVAFNYNLKYTDSGALITHVESQQIYEISPLNELSGTALMETRQNMTLIEIITNVEIMPETLMQNHGNLYYQFQEDLPQMALHLIKTNNPEQGITEKLEQLVQLNQLQIHQETPAKFLELIELSRAATHENLESLWKQFVDRQLYRHWLLNAVSVAGTSHTFLFLKQRIHNEDLNFFESAVTLTLAFHLTKTDKTTLKAAADLVTSNAVQKSLVLHKLAYLAYGSMINRHCSISPHCPAEILQPLHDLAMGTDKSHEGNIVLALKAMGNAGEPASINYIKKFLPGFSNGADVLSERVPRHALFALRKISRKKAATVREMAFEIFMNRTLPAQTRMMACIVFFETKPTLPLVTAMASFLQKESNLQVAAFAYSHMKVLAMGRIPQLENLSAACKIAIKLLHPRLERLSIRYSRVLHVDGYMCHISKDPLPQTISPILPCYLMSQTFPPKPLNDVVGLRLESLSDMVKIQNIPFEQYSTYKKIKELGKLLQGWKELPSEKPPLAAYLKLFSHEIAFAALDKELAQMAEQLLNKPRELMTVLFQKGLAGKWVQPILAGEIRHIVPTCVGLPLEFGLYTTSVVHAAAKVSGQISLDLTNDFRPEQLLESSMHLSAEINPSVYTHLVAVMGINTPYFQTGLEFHANFHASIPMNFNVNIDLKEETFTFETTPVQQETELLAMRLEDNLRRGEKAVSYPLAFYIKLPALGFQTCLTMKQCDTGFPGETYLQNFWGKCEIKLAMKPDVAKTKIKLEIQAGSETDSEISHMRHNEEYDESSSEEEQRHTEKRKNSMKKTKENEQSNIARPHKSSGMVATLSTIQKKKKLKIYQLVLHTDLHSSRPTVQIFVSDLKGPKRIKFCGDISILSSQNAEGYLKWGKDCRDYKIAAKIAYGQFAGYPAMQIKLECPQIPPRIEEAARDTAYMLGFSEVEQKNPSKQASVILALTSPRTCSLIVKLPNITIYDTNIGLPLPLYVGQHTRALERQSHVWSFISDVPTSVLENLKAGYIFIGNEENGLLLKAPEIGIEKLHYDGNMLKIQVPFSMTGKTCGICGRYDAEYVEEYKMPSGYVAENAVSFAQSWMVPQDSCAIGDVAVTKIVDPAFRAAWINQQVELAKRQYMDGINIDIEQEVAKSSPEYDALTALVKETTEAFHKAIPGSQVTFDVAWCPDCIDKRCYNYTGIAESCDFVFVMSYDEQSQVWSDCIARANAPYNQTIAGYEQYISMGIDPQKIVMGVPWYGYDYTCLSLSQDHICSIAKVPFRGAPCSDAAGRQIPYRVIMSQENSSLSGILWNDEYQAPYLEYKAPNGVFHQVWFDDPRSISLKAAYVTDRGLRGIGMWNGDCLDYSGGYVAEEQTEAMWEALTPE
ncbi:hypothetical protein JD844_017691 [Phrynosoma platyrhinos]|uniref:Phosvitin n=1 Tax=Phrynosoma platyrhinos TaxID=52577 RepID=A0ABQ7SMB4_PHRPL|nr:hypothetical protein JD844_017691 [Phrynosoma platyrhinos]